MFFAAYDEPYFVAIESETIEIKTTDDLAVQTICLPKGTARLICRSKQGKLFVASSGEVIEPQQKI